MCLCGADNPPLQQRLLMCLPAVMAQSLVSRLPVLAPEDGSERLRFQLQVISKEEALSLPQSVSGRAPPMSF